MTYTVKMVDKDNNQTILKEFDTKDQAQKYMYQRMKIYPAS